MKRDKYSIQFSNIERCLSTEISISKREFNNQLDFLQKQLENTKHDAYPVTHTSTTTYEYTTYTITTYIYTIGTADTTLTHYHTKDGYHFKK